MHTLCHMCHLLFLCGLLFYNKILLEVKMGCSVCDEYDIFSYMEIGFVSLMLLLLVCLIISEFVYMRKVNRLEKEVNELKESVKTKEGVKK